MSSRAKTIEDFKTACDEIISAPYILSTVKISNMMKIIAQSRMLYEIFEYALKDFDYRETRRTYFIKPDNPEDVGKFLLPPDDRVFLALAFSVLYSIDTKEEDLMSLLGNYFYADDLNSAYNNFIIQFLKPFKYKVLDTVRLIIDREKNLPDAMVKKSGIVTLKPAEAQVIDGLLDQSKGVILQYKIDPKLKAELIALYDNFKSVIFEGDVKVLKVAFLGYKYAALYHRKLDVSVEKIEEILHKNGVM